VTATVRVWVVRLGLPAAELLRCTRALDAGERTRAATYQNPEDRHRFIVAHGALRILVGGALGVAPESLELCSGRHGKPALAAGYGAVQVNLSHSGDLVLVAVSDTRPVGVDVQHAVSGLDTAAMSHRFFPPNEARYVASAPDARAMADRFGRLWVRKEAAVKAVGGPLWPNLGVPVHGRDLVRTARPADLLRVAEVGVPDGFHAAVALVGAEPYTVEACDWPAEAPRRSVASVAV
jgi:4'-phosphopantetheinyl transferase